MPVQLQAELIKKEQLNIGDMVKIQNANQYGM